MALWFECYLPTGNTSKALDYFTTWCQPHFDKTCVSQAMGRLHCQHNVVQPITLRGLFNRAPPALRVYPVTADEHYLQCVLAAAETTARVDGSLSDKLSTRPDDV